MANQAQSQRPTQKLIAARAGVSIGAVSRALADDPRMSEDTRVRIRRIAADIGYAPDRAAQRLRTGKTQVINLILPPHEEILGFGTSLIRGISRALDKTSYHLVVMPNFGSEGDEELIERIVRNRLADGILFSRAQPLDPRVKFLSEAGFPFVTHGRTELATQHPYVDYDNYTFAYEAAARMIRKGARNLSILLPPSALTFRQHLLHGFMMAVREAGVDHEVLDGATLDSTPSEIKAAVARRFSAPARPDGLILPGEVSGMASLAAIQDIGLVPERDVKMVVKQTTGLFGLVRPCVDSIFEDLSDAGYQMATFLLRSIQGDDPDDLQYLQPISEALVG